MKLSAGLDRNDDATVFMPLVKDAVALCDELLERLGGESDFVLASRWKNENKSAAQLNLRRFLRKITITHTPLSPVLNTEQGGKSGVTHGNVKREDSVKSLTHNGFTPLAVKA